MKFSRIRKSNTILRKQTCRRAAKSFGGLGVLHVKPMKNIKGILGLCNSEPKLSLRNLNPQEIIESAKVFKFKYRNESSNKRRNMLGVVPCDDNIIHIEKEIDENALRLKNEQGTINKGSSKPKME